MTHNRTYATGDRRCTGLGAGQRCLQRQCSGTSSQWLITIAKTLALVSQLPAKMNFGASDGSEQLF